MIFHQWRARAYLRRLRMICKAPAPRMRISPLLPHLVLLHLDLHHNGVVEHFRHQGLRGLWLKMLVCLRLRAQTVTSSSASPSFPGSCALLIFLALTDRIAARATGSDTICELCDIDDKERWRHVQLTQIAANRTDNDPRRTCTSKVCSAVCIQ